jgi:phage-related protein (TIGR01555 family)
MTKQTKTVRVGDSLRNLAANLGTPRDKASHAEYVASMTDDQQLMNAYRYTWLASKIVDAPAKDAVRNWRNWQAEAEQITAIEAEEKRLGLMNKLLEALIADRLLGGAAIFIAIKGQQDLSIPLVPSQVKKGSISHLSVLPRGSLNSIGPELDPRSERYGKPKAYQMTAGGDRIEIHPSRLVLFTGKPIPDANLTATNNGWGDSVLQSVFDACRNADATLANVVSLIYEAKVDVLGIPDLASYMADPQSQKLLVERAYLAAAIKGNNGMLIRDALETYDSKSFSFGSLDAIAELMLQVCAGAADIPATRLLGRAPAGLNSTGESDMRNYYDGIRSMQELLITPAMALLDECLIYSALGSRPPEIYYQWAPLWQPTEKERAENGKAVAETIKTVSETGLIDPAALAPAAVNTLTEWGILPGLEQAMQDLPDDPDAEFNTQNTSEGAE